MSSDNGLVLLKTAEGYELREYCASTDDTWDEMIPHGVFATADEALLASQRIYTEYGVSFEDTSDPVASTQESS